MADQVIEGTLDIETQMANAPFDALTVNVTGGIITAANLQQSNYLVIRETPRAIKKLGGPPPAPEIIFSVRADGVVTTESIETAGTVNITGPSSPKPFNVLTVNATSFGVPDNLTQSYFIIASDIDAAPPNGIVKFSVRGDGQLTAGQIQSPTIDQFQQQINKLSNQLQTLDGNLQTLSDSVNQARILSDGAIANLQNQINDLSAEQQFEQGEIDQG